MLKNTFYMVDDKDSAKDTILSLSEMNQTEDYSEIELPSKVVTPKQENDSVFLSGDVLRKSLVELYNYLKYENDLLSRDAL